MLIYLVNGQAGRFAFVFLQEKHWNGFLSIMARKDTYHHIVRRSLEKDGWKITHDPLVIQAGKRKIKVDLGAE